MVDGREALDFRVLLPECLNRADAVQVLLDALRERRETLLDRGGCLVHPAGEEVRGECDERKRREEEQRQRR